MTLDDYIGIPYTHRGCWELVRKVYWEQFHIALPSYSGDVLDDASQGELADAIADRRGDWHRVAPGDEQRGDAVLFRVLGADAHIGLVVRPGMFLHVFRDQCSCIESYRGPRWAPRVAGFYRHQDRL